MIFLLKLAIYAFIVPIVVLFVAGIGIQISCEYHWGSSYLHGHSGFKIMMWYIILFLYLTIIYYIFCVLFFIIKKVEFTLNKVYIRYLILAVFIIVPIIYYNSTSNYDYRITISFAMFHTTYYIFFLLSRYLLSMILKKRQLKTK